MFSLAQVLADEGLHRLVDPACLQRELAEAADLTPEEMNLAAREIIRRSQHIEPSDHPPDAIPDSTTPDLEVTLPLAVSRSRGGSRTPSPGHEMAQRGGGFPASDAHDRHPMVKMTSVTTL